jgi:CMP-N-acetylneuraminic acid synthetase
VTIVAMIPARMGSQRLKQKNLTPLRGAPLIAHAIRKCREADVFDEIWVNSEHEDFAAIAAREGVRFHRRPPALADDAATSEQFVAEFLENHVCQFVFQVHSIAPLLTTRDLVAFVAEMRTGRHDALLSVVDEPLEAFCDGAPINFSLDRKTNSQDLKPVRRICWAVTAWRRETYLAATAAGACATYAGRVGLFSVNRLAGHVVKTAQDLAMAEALYPIAHAQEAVS